MLFKYLMEAGLNINGKTYPKFGNALICAGGAGCFDENTLVKTNDGYKLIKDIKTGDLVETLNENTNVSEFKEVEELKAFESTKPMIKLTFDNGEEVICTEDHEFLVDGKWVMAKDLKIKKEYIKNYSKTVYDLKIKDNHNYKITESDLIVHNSGKGFVLNNVCLFQGRTFDVDNIKKNLIKMKDTTIIYKKYLEWRKQNPSAPETINDLKLEEPEHVSLLHKFSSEMGYGDAVIKTFITNASLLPADRKPNVIFDCTLKSFSDLTDFKKMLDLGGYDPKNIHLVWVLNKFEVALKQNDERERKVSINVMFKTHEGVSENLSNILKDLNSIRNIVDGDIWIVPNQTKVDNDAVVSLRKTFSGKEVKSVRYVKEYSAYQVKKSGKAPKSYDEICSDVIDNLHKSKIIDKIKDYVPVSTKDNW